MKSIWSIALTVFALLWANSVDASADSTCYPDWKIKQTDHSMCSSTSLLSPGNDTRVNLLMLLNDRHGSTGVAGRYSCNLPERRSDAEPFGFSVFALKLGPARRASRLINLTSAPAA